MATELMPYDILQVKWPGSHIWQDFATLRVGYDFGLARVIVTRGRDSDGRPGSFRVVRGGTGKVILEPGKGYK